MKYFLGFLLSFSLLACKGPDRIAAPKVEGAETSEPQDASVDAGVDLGPPAPIIELADSPEIDLIANHRRWHVFNDGLVIPFGTDGIHKYSQEYRRPFGDIVEKEGVTGRKLKSRVVTLHVPWHSPALASARIWVFATKGQRVELKVNGRRVGVESLDAGWQEVIIPIKEGLLQAGENTLQLHAKSAPIYHSLELIEGKAELQGTQPPLSPVSETSLTGFKRYQMWLEIPKTAWLDLTTSAKGVVRIKANGKSQELLDTDQGSSLTDLSEFAEQLVVLEFESEATTRWENPRIALSAARTRTKPKFDNAILLVVDAMRSDTLKLYGETRIDTPRMTEEGNQRGVVYQYNQAASPSSPPSHGSIQTGMIARVHGVAGDKGNLKPGVKLISTILGEQGIKSAYVGNNQFGMRRLKEAGKFDAYVEPSRLGLGTDCSAVVSETLRFVKDQNSAGERFFVSMLPFETHAPYRFHEGITEKYFPGPWPKPVGKNADGYLLNDIAAGRKVLNKQAWKQLRALYDGEAEYMDRCFGTLIDGLAELGIKDSTAIILTSDHGEGMFEHKKMGHAYGLYSELTNVPFVIFGKGLNGEGVKKVNVPTQVIDIAPSILDLMGSAPSPDIQGESTLDMALRDGPWTAQVISSEYGRAFSMRSADWRLLVQYDGSQELYDLKADPTEQKDVVSENPSALRYLREMTGLFLEYRSDWHARTWGNWANHKPGFGE